MDSECLSLPTKKLLRHIRRCLPPSTLTRITVSWRRVFPTLITFYLHRDRLALSVAFPLCLCSENNVQPMFDVPFLHRLWFTNKGLLRKHVAYTHRLFPSHKGHRTSDIGCTYHSLPAHTTLKNHTWPRNIVRCLHTSSTWNLIWPANISRIVHTTVYRGQAW